MTSSDHQIPIVESETYGSNGNLGIIYQQFSLQHFIASGSTMLQFRTIPYGSPDYDTACALRQKWLRTPLGLTLDPEDLKNESNDRHFGIWNGSDLIACLVITPVSMDEVKLRQMCVEEEVRGQGIGSKLIKATEAVLRDSNVRRIQLSARATARGFYEALGYRATGLPFIEVTIEHIKMIKDLQPTSS